MTKAYGYLRVSGPGQIDKDGLIRQAEALKQYAKTNGMELVKVFREEGVSGTLEERPELARLLVDLEQNGHDIKTVLVEKLDRLARDLMVQEAIVRDFQKQGYELVSALEGPNLCDDDPTRKLIRQLFGAVAEYEKSMLVLKLRAARERRKAATGKCEGRKGFGETEQEQAVIRRMQAMRRKYKGKPKHTYQEIADKLNSEGIKTKTGRPWTRALTHKVFTRGLK